MNKREHLKSMTDQILRLLEADGERQPDQEFMPPVETHNDAELFDLEKEKLFRLSRSRCKPTETFTMRM